MSIEENQICKTNRIKKFLGTSGIKKEIDSEIKIKNKNEIIVPSTSPWASRIEPIKKMDN